jgi:uncharacterized repeat protein (TIGR01451 family)
MTKYIRIAIVNGLLLFVTGFHFLDAQTVATETFNTAGTYTFTVPFGVTSITVQAWGGGGGARGDGSSSRSGGGGGAFASSTLSVTAAQTYTVVVGAGGVATANPGQAGQNSVFGNNLVVANGGTGGGSSGGNGGTVANSTGTIRFAGGSGGDQGGTSLLGAGGGGGGSALSTGSGGNGANGGLTTGGNGGSGAGNGGDGGNNNQSGSAGTAPGGGGGGRGSGGSRSGRGADGRIIITYSSNVLDLAITKTASTSSTTVGQAVTFTVGVTNNGPTNATNTVVTDLLPTGYTFISATLSPSTSTYASDTGIWTIGSLASGASVSMVLVGIVNTAGTYNNTASVTANQPDSNAANNSATAVVTVCKAGSSSPLFN